MGSNPASPTNGRPGEASSRRSFLVLADSSADRPENLIAVKRRRSSHAADRLTTISLLVVLGGPNVGNLFHMTITDIRMNTPEHVADLAMGVELMAIEIEERLEWAEAQGRAGDALVLTAQLTEVLDELADIAELIPAAA